ncbi:MAG TPA: hypothetical protein VLC54_07970 [Anaeromyxobacter sp.]|nr:hypothetical protein [Anaeromyxobacter sp.]
MKTWLDGRECVRNRRVGELRIEVRAARDRSLEPGARRRAERRVQLLAGLLDRGRSTLDA